MSDSSDKLPKSTTKPSNNLYPTAETIPQETDPKSVSQRIRRLQNNESKGVLIMILAFLLFMIGRVLASPNEDPSQARLGIGIEATFYLVVLLSFLIFVFGFRMSSKVINQIPQQD